MIPPGDGPGAEVLPHLFVYGTLRPGDVRWSFLAPWVVDDGVDDAVPGRLFDTGRGYPAAVFRNVAGADVVVGRTYELRRATLTAALRVLDDEEGTVLGLYRRVEVTTVRGVRAWAYQYGAGLDLTPILGGDWRMRRGSPELAGDGVHGADVGVDLGRGQGRAELDRDPDALRADDGP